jgi:Fic family protein
MLNFTLLTRIDTLKARLDRLTYHSNAIEGNTLTQSETQIVVENGITIDGHQHSIEYKVTIAVRKYLNGRSSLKTSV